LPKLVDLTCNENLTQECYRQSLAALVQIFTPSLWALELRSETKGDQKNKREKYSTHSRKESQMVTHAVNNKLAMREAVFRYAADRQAEDFQADCKVFLVAVTLFLLIAILEYHAVLDSGTWLAPAVNAGNPLTVTVLGPA
jgi:hypothetical protein